MVKARFPLFLLLFPLNINHGTHINFYILSFSSNRPDDRIGNSTLDAEDKLVVICEDKTEATDADVSLKEKRIENPSSSAFVCNECGKHLASKMNLKHHLENHRKSSSMKKARKVKRCNKAQRTQYQCEFCDKVFQQSSTLKDHVRVHTGQ